MKKYILISLIILSVQVAFGQNYFDALRYSQTEYGGTARSISMGSAFGALGADFSSASINPAGLGMYRSFEFVLSPTLNINQVESDYLGNKELNDKYNFNFNNLSYVATSKTGAETGIISITFGAGFNRLKNFNSNQLIKTRNAQTTLLNYFTDYANSIGNPKNFDYHYEGMAWNTWLIDQDPDPNVLEGIYFNDLTDYSSYDITDNNNNVIGKGYEATGIRPHTQKSILSKTGHIDEYDFALGLNINHKIYWGATLGLVDLEYGESVSFSEYDDQDKSDFLKNYTVDTRLNDSGFGVNFKTGVIFRPAKPVRIGLAFHTPTFYSIGRVEDKKIAANFDQEVGNTETGISTNFDYTNNIQYSYRFQTPLKAVISAAYLFGDKALISADYEIVNYGSSKFRASSNENYDYSNNNSDVQNFFNSSSNLRIGGEYRATPNFSLRAGYNLIGNPWKSSYTSNNGEVLIIENHKDIFGTYSAGFGYRQQNFFIDFAYRLSQFNYTQKVHELDFTNPNKGINFASMKELNNQATISFGFRF